MNTIVDAVVNAVKNKTGSLYTSYSMKRIYRVRSRVTNGYVVTDITSAVEN